MLPALLIFLATSTRPIVVALPPTLDPNLLVTPPPLVWDDENLTTTRETVLSVQLDPGDDEPPFMVPHVEEEEIGVAAAAAGGGFFARTTGFAHDLGLHQQAKAQGKHTQEEGEGGQGYFSLQPLVDFIRGLFPNHALLR